MKRVAGDCASGCTVVGERKAEFHCNGDPQDHQDWDTDGLWPVLADPRGLPLQSDVLRSKWNVLHGAKSNEDFDTIARQLIPREMIMSRPSIELHKRLTFGEPSVNDIVDYNDVNVGVYRRVVSIERYFDRWVFNRPDDRARCPSLCLVGPSGVGKTDYIRRLGRHVYYNTCVRSRRMNGDASFMLFDDVCREGFGAGESWKQFFGCQKTLSLRDLWWNGELTWGRPCIFTFNPDEDPRLNASYDLDFLTRNCIFIDVEEPLYMLEGTGLSEVYMPRCTVPVLPACGIRLDFITD